MRRFIRLALGAMGAILITTASLLTIREARTEAAYQKLGEQAAESRDAKTDPSRDWRKILTQNEEAVGWITVGQTPIDYPVVQPGTSTPEDYYLSHNFWRQADAAGCPYLDVRSCAAGAHTMIFGHRLGMTDRMFGPLNRAWKATVFETIGAARLETPREVFEFSPLCALRVDCDFADIQRFAFQSDEEVRAWLSGIVRQASARCGNAEELVMQAQRALTLVTCAGIRNGGRERTLVVFVSSA